MKSKISLIVGVAVAIGSAQAASLVWEYDFVERGSVVLGDDDWTSFDGDGGVDDEGLWGTDNRLDKRISDTLVAGEVITMNAAITRFSDGSAGANGYAYVMEILLWDGADTASLESVAGGSQQGLSGDLESVSYTVGAEDAGKYVVFRYGHDGAGVGSGAGYGATTSVAFEIVPEPSAMALSALGVLGLLMRRRR